MLKNVILFCGILISTAACSTTKTTADNTEAKKISTAKINTQLGMAYLERHDMHLAKQKLLTALAEAPSIPEPWYTMAYFLEVTGDMQQARQDYQKAIAVAPNRGDAHNNYGTFLCRTGDYRGAIQQFIVATHDPAYLDAASAYENAGLCATKIPDRKLAINYFKQAVKRDPTRLASVNELKQLEAKQIGKA